jgi:oxygen-independent coproporphyrinogen-3 oxidase
MENHIPEYIGRLVKEIEFYGKKYSRKLPVKTIFFGGGTPSILEIEFFKNIYYELQKNYVVLPDAEISLEANPGTVTMEYLKSLREIGFNRISFGLQSSNPVFLQLLGRIHDHYQSIQAINWAKQAGFSNINLDLIYGLPGQSIEDWEKTISYALDLGTHHISLYALGIEENTLLFDWVEKGVVENPDPDVAAEMYEVADNLLLKNKFECYEISNYCKVDENFDFRCQHNLQYWRNQPYIGLGAGAHGLIENTRYENIGGIVEYIRSMKVVNRENEQFSSAILEKNDIDHYTEMQETMMLGLRLVNEGVSIKQFRERFLISPLQVFTSEIKILLESNLIEIADDIIRLTKPGRLLGNQAFIQFVN